VEANDISLQDLAALKHYENLKEVHLRWLAIPEKKDLPLLKRCTNLRRLTLAKWKKLYILSSEELYDFIMDLKDLTFLHIIYRDIYNCGHFESLFDEVNALVLPRRPNFKFYVSCCSKFPESRVPA
jgi:hypothetical protein